MEARCGNRATKRCEKLAVCVPLRIGITLWPSFPALSGCELRECTTKGASPLSNCLTRPRKRHSRQPSSSSPPGQSFPPSQRHDAGTQRSESQPNSVEPHPLEPASRNPPPPRLPPRRPPPLPRPAITPVFPPHLHLTPTTHQGELLGSRCRRRESGVREAGMWVVLRVAWMTRTTVGGTAARDVLLSRFSAFTDSSPSLPAHTHLPPNRAPYTSPRTHTLPLHSTHSIHPHRRRFPSLPILSSSTPLLFILTYLPSSITYLVSLPQRGFKKSSLSCHMHHVEISCPHCDGTFQRVPVYSVQYSTNLSAATPTSHCHLFHVYHIFSFIKLSLDSDDCILL